MIADIIKLLEEGLEELKPKLAKCRELQAGNINEETKRQLTKKAHELEQKRHRLLICTDILQGRAFIIHEVDGELTVVKPAESTAKLIDVAEKYGAKITSVEFKQEKML